MAGRAATRCARASARTTASTSNPSLKIPHTSSLYEYALHFLPLKEIDAIAARMTDEGLARDTTAARAMTDEGLARYDGGKGDRHYKDWLVMRQKVLKWIGAWMYILAFPIEL